ncbi:MAG TPA: hypothetical protein VGM30_22685 [Puia sp.]|jgi:hypothetical protein
MKNILFLLGCIAMLPVTAQKIIEKHIPLNQHTLVSMNFQISDSIRIITWNKSEVYIKSSINVNNNQYNDNYQMSFDEADERIRINGKLEFEKGKGCNGGVYNSNNGDSSSRCCCCSCTSTIIHEVYVPENVDIAVETINGNIVLSGNIAGIKARTISGYIDLAVSPQRKADLKLHTITGTMYSDIDLPLPREGGSMRRVGGSTVSTQINGDGGKPISLQTISGDIFVRKAG